MWELPSQSNWECKAKERRQMMTALKVFSGKGGWTKLHTSPQTSCHNLAQRIYSIIMCLMFTKRTNSQLNYHRLHYLFATLSQTMYLVSLKSRQTASFLCISGDCHVYIYFIIACKKHLNRNRIARTPTAPLCYFSHWMVDCPSDKSTKSISDTLSPGLLGKPTNCTNSPASIHCRGTGCSLEMAQWKLILTEISNRIQKQPLSPKRQLWRHTKEAIWRGGWRVRFIHRKHCPVPPLERGPLNH